MRHPFFALLVLCSLLSSPAFAAQTDAAKDQTATSAAQSTAIKTISPAGLMELITTSRGKVLFINFFATWCPPCREEIPELIALRSMYPEDKILFVGLSLDENADKLQDFAAAMKFNYPIYKAADGVAQMFGIASIPHNVVFDQNGEVAISQPGMVTRAELKPFFDQLLAPGKGKK